MIPKTLFLSYVALSLPHQQRVVVRDDGSIVASVLHQPVSVAADDTHVATTNFFRHPEPSPLLQQKPDPLIDNIDSAATATGDYSGSATVKLDVSSHLSHPSSVTSRLVTFLHSNMSSFYTPPSFHYLPDANNFVLNNS